MRGRANPDEVKYALFLEFRLPLGCLVHMTPVFESIKQSRPGMQLAVATTGLGLQVLRHSRFVDVLIDAPDPTVDLRAAAFGLRRQLRVRGFRPDCVLTGASDQRTRIALMGILGSTGWRGGYTQKTLLYHRPLGYDPARSLIANNLRLAKMLGCNLEMTRPRVFFSAADAEKAARLLGRANPEGRPVAVFVTQNSGGQRTGWHVDRFAAVVRHADQRGLGVLYVGTAAEALNICAIQVAAGGVGTSIAGETTVNELSAVMALSDFVIALDTGPMHVARAAGTPMVVLGPSWQKPIEWLPMGVANIRILRGEDREDVSDGYRLDEISAQSVMSALDDLMRSYPPSLAEREARASKSLSAADNLATR